MAHFYAEVQGSRGAVHRLGGKSSGIRAVAKGWLARVEVVGYYDEKRGIDCFDVYFDGKRIATCEQGGEVLFNYED